MQAGLTPVYADIDEHSQLVSIDSVIALLSSDVLAIVVTHLYGGVVDVAALKDAIASAGFPGISILEDCAQAHGATLGARKAGTLADISTFSFYPTKNLGALGDGGAILTSNPALAELARSLHQYGWSSKYTISRQLGRNSRLDELQAAMLTVLLPHLDTTNAERRSIVERYKTVQSETWQMVDGGPGAVAHLAVILSEQREELRQHLAAQGIATDIHYPLLDVQQPAWRDREQTSARGLPISERSVQKILTIPCFPGMSEEEIVRVMEALDSWKLR
jgi:dTDP-4-amino-4,6-dideoxygalactose transaminase